VGGEAEQLGDRPRTTAAPALVVPAPPKRAPRSLTSVSAKKLSDGGNVSPSNPLIVGDWTAASWVAPAGVAAAPEDPPTVTRPA